LAAIGQGSTNISIVKISLLTLSAVGQGSALIIRSVVKNLSVSVVTEPNFLKNINKIFSVSNQGSAFLSKTKLTSFNVTGTGIAAIQFIALKNFLTTALSNVSFNKDLTKSFAAIGNGIAEIIKIPEIIFTAIGQGSGIFDLTTHITVIKGFFAATMRREGYYRSYITRIKPDDNLDIHTEGYSDTNEI
jgi:hypothetical protein